MDREMSLVADEGMRILSPRFNTQCPYFLASNDELWNAWRVLQRQGHGEISFWFERGWKIDVRHLPNGGVVMRLELRFEPTERN